MVSEKIFCPPAHQGAANRKQHHKVARLDAQGDAMFPTMGATGFDEVVLIDLVALLPTTATIWILWYCFQTIIRDNVRDLQFFLTFIIVFVPFVMLIYFGAAILIYDALATRSGRPTVLPLELLSPEVLGAAVVYFGLTAWLWSRWRKL
jgi:hypothetical protein